ncbi:cAMP-dependent protein kinase regulatory subunit, putative [Perkinsus marinus ATCC 50983]|uniref:cAMP-dependent protein kinase regulatory subunit n=1 Tax=Perkinsus marinus (strain ATCC 50983 / TXsc) TaxID=423536 RepID=C5KD96_PERM5|nr:cAMP-dependent protein kinase regulatory subunit, putative [Perkinsus marinus ATCC 50983]EER17529.1 cAMP-dependent protein kinase regulatory subunit, putative [Perkinsus marinus ATCC 50983]|eukprot:XP_002785733.1 cAMP-dependent protein kinase regulatory subunit, putative [Perkinsus marinus ATCC 50983]
MSSLDSLRIPQSKKDYIVQKLNPLLEDMVTECLTEMPNDPTEFMIKFLRERKSNGSKETSSSESLQAENTQLKQEIKNLRDMLKHSVGDGVGTTDGDNDSVLDSDDDDDDYVDEIPASFVQSEAQRGKSRASVSAEAYGEWNVKKVFTPPVYPKGDEQKARIKEVLSKSFLFAALDSNNLAIVIDAMKEEILPAKERVINQGDDGDFLFVVESGELEVYKKFPGEDEERMLKVCEAGDVFGELALLYNVPRAASVEAKTECTLLRLDRETFNHIVKDAAANKRERYESFLKSVSLLASMDAYERSQIADALKPVSVAAGDVIVKEGDPGDTFYVIENGDCEALKDRGGVMSYVAGDYFGELALLRGEPRAASVKAKTDANLLALDRRSFRRLLGPLQDLLVKACDRYARTKWRMSVPTARYFHDFDQALDEKYEAVYGINAGLDVSSTLVPPA